MKTLYSFLLLLTCSSLAIQSKAQVLILASDVSSPPATDCVATLYTVAGTHGNTNYGYSGPSVSTVGFNITIDMQYYSGFAPQPGLTPFSENIDLGTLAVGTYTVTTNAYVDGMLTSTDVGSFNVVTCCSVTSSFSLTYDGTCFPTPVTGTDLSTGATSVMWYIDGVFESSASNPSLLPATAGIHTITLVAINGGCADTSELTLEVYIPASIDFGPDTVICDTASLILNPNIMNATYFWQDATTAPIYTVTSAGTYWVDAVDENGCATGDTIVVATVDCSLGLDALEAHPNIALFPNPATSFISIDGLSVDALVALYSLEGEILLEASHTEKIDVSTLKAGIYFLEITSAVGRSAHRVEVIR